MFTILWMTPSIAVAAPGDECDPVDDLVVGAPGQWNDSGEAFGYRGGPGGLEASPSWVWAGETDGEFGWVVTAPGDVNGDGYDDLVVGSREDAYLFLGGTGGPALTQSSVASGNSLFAAAGLGDTDGDGFGELVVGPSQTRPSCSTATKPDFRLP